MERNPIKTGDLTFGSLPFPKQTYKDIMGGHGSFHGIIREVFV